MRAKAHLRNIYSELRRVPRGKTSGMPTDNITTYEPDNCLNEGYLSMLGDILREIRQNRWLIFQLFKRDLASAYKQSLVGILWAFILPIIAVGTFIALSRSGLFNIGAIGVPYPIYAVLGIAFWQLFSAGLIASSNSLINAGPMIARINFSKKSLVIASTGQALVSFVVQFGLVLLLFLYYAFPPSAAIVLLPFLVVPLLLITLGLGFILSLFNGIFRDVANILSVVLAFLLLLTPVLYAKPTSGAIALFTSYNPIYYLIAVPRDLILIGTTTEWAGFALATAVSVCVFVACLLTFHITETRVAERM